MIFDNLMEPIRADLEELDRAREEVLRLTRLIIRSSGEAIKAIHRKNFQVAEEKLDAARKQMQAVYSITERRAELRFQGYVTSAAQELGEAALLHAYIYEKRLPSASELSIHSYPYLMALTDFIGELRRCILDDLRKNEFDRIEMILETMDELITALFSLDFVEGLLPGFRRKVDYGRILVERTRGDVTNALPREQLRKELQRLSDLLSKHHK
ncbi:MAG: hypothetical protein ACE5R6_02215 [Candidatus Heimdallarchaeota archaeon]